MAVRKNPVKASDTVLIKGNKMSIGGGAAEVQAGIAGLENKILESEAKLKKFKEAKFPDRDLIIRAEDNISFMKRMVKEYKR